MKTGTIIAIMIMVCGCTSSGIKSVPRDRADAYLNGIAHASVDECGETFKLIHEYQDAAVPVVLKALDLYSNPSNAPSGHCRILNGVSWTYRINPGSTSNVVDSIMIEAAKSSNPGISRRGQQWVELREEEKRKAAEQGAAPLPSAPLMGTPEGAR